MGVNQWDEGCSIPSLLRGEGQDGGDSGMGVKD